MIVVDRYSVEKMFHICSGVTSPPASSVCRWTTPENSIWSRRGRSMWCSVFMMYATPPLPDCELTRMTASYVRPTSFGSIGRYGTAQVNSSTSTPASDASWRSQSKPLLMASWCDPENAVYTRSPAYGCRSCTGSWLQYSTVRRISSI